MFKSVRISLEMCLSSLVVRCWRPPRGNRKLLDSVVVRTVLSVCVLTGHGWNQCCCRQRCARAPKRCRTYGENIIGAIFSGSSSILVRFFIDKRPVIARFKNGVKVVKQPTRFKFAGCIKLLPTTFEVDPVPELWLGLDRKTQGSLQAAITASGEAPISQATLRRMIRRWVSLFNETSSCPRALYTTLLDPETCVQSIGSPLSPT